jgi:DNA-directed RNA polymerase specialized sigma24 family protein
MPRPPGPDTDQLLADASRGDAAARDRLLERHRRRLRQLVAVRMDRRLAARVDPSDVVQEALAEAAAVLRVGEGAVKMRVMRALQRLRDLLDEGDMP